MKNFFKGSIITLSLGAIAFGVAFFSQYRAPAPQKDVLIIDNDIPETPQEKLLNSIGSISCFDVNAFIDLSLDYGGIIRLDFNGVGNASDPSDISLSGDMNLNLDGNKIAASVSYINETIYLDYNDNYFYLETSSLMDFIDMLPSTGVSFELPEELTSLDMNAIQDEILAMEDPVRSTDGNGYFFTFNLSERLGLDNEIKLYITTNEEYEFTGIRTDRFIYESIVFNKVDISLTREESVEVVNPLNGPHAYDYQNFSPFFTLYEDIYQITRKRAQTFNISVDLDKYESDEEGSESSKDFLGADIDFSYDLDNKGISLKGDILENGRTHTLGGAYQNKSVYLAYHDVKVSIQTGSISALLEWVMKMIGNEKLEEAMASMSSTIDAEQIIGIIGDADKMLGEITLTEEELGININPSDAGLDSVSSFSVSVKFDGDAFKSLSINNLRIKDFETNVVLTLKEEYDPFVIAEEQYVALEPALPLVNAVAEILDDNAYRIEFDAQIVNEDENVKDITVDGGLQFNIADQFGYGELTIVDRDEYHHNIKADMRTPDNIIFSYNNTMNGKFKSQTLLDIFDIVKDIVENPDDHFVELFQDLFDQMETMPLMDAINNKDYGLLLDQHILSNLAIEEGRISTDINLALVGMSDVTFHLELNYTELTILSLKISNLVFDGNTISANIYLKDFDDSLESSRLDPQKEYMDFSDIKVLLQLGINSSKYNYWHFDANAQVKFTVLGISFDKNIPLDVKVRNDHGKVTVAAELKEIPTVALINSNDTYYSATDRKASIYFEDGNFYILRTERVREKWYSISYKDYTLVKVCDTDYFLENIIDIMCRDILSLQDLVMNEITKSTSNSENYQIPYEKILKSFIYNEKGGYFYFDIDVGALANSDSLTGLNLTVYDDLSTNELTGLKASLNISVGITIQVNLNATLVNHEREVNSGNIITTVESYKNKYASIIADYLNKKSNSDNVCSSQESLG